MTRIRRFPNATNDQASGNFDGRWLVWAEYHSLTIPDDFTVWSWDSQTGEVRQIGAAARAPSGEFWPSPLRHPEARDGLATWTQGSGADGLTDVHVFDLTGGSDRVVRHGHAEASFLAAGGLVLWPESLKQGALTVMLAADARSGRSVGSPAGLRGLRGVSWPATDGTSLVFPSAEFWSLWWSPSLAAAPQRVYHGRYAHPVGVPVEIAGRFVLFGVAPHTYLADTVARRYVEISPGGWGLLDRKSLVLLHPSARKAIHLIDDVDFIPLQSLPPMPPCG